MIVKWSESDVAAMSAEQARELREQIKNTVMMSDSPAQRRDTFRLLSALDQKIGHAPASVEQRAADAKAFLYGTRDPGVAARAWAMAVELHGSEREAIRRGHRKPEVA